MNSRSRREFLEDVGRGMLVAQGDSELDAIAVLKMLPEVAKPSY